VRSFVDGHILLDRQLAEKGHYPAIDVARSVSRVMVDVADAKHRAAARRFRAALATFAEMADLIRVGAYSKGSSPDIDTAIALKPVLDRYLRQEPGTYSPLEQTRRLLGQIADAWTH
jgi:flagellar biosynthesis/type III secretory pathway ATPase